MKKANLKKSIENGLDRIKDIKKNINGSTASPELCRAEVYDMWNNFFDDPEQDNNQ